MLDIDHAAAFLFDHGLVDREWIIEGELTLRTVARRHRNLRVEGPGGTGYLIRQPHELATAGHETLAREAAFYRFCQQEPDAADVTTFLPRLVLHDPERAVHVLELVPGAATLAAYHLRHPPESFPVTASRQLGQCLGTLHRTFRSPGLTSDPRFRWLDRSIPWVFHAHQRPTPPMFADLSPAGAEFFRIIQAASGVGPALESLAREWRHETLVHGDIKSDNILVSTATDRDEIATGTVWIVDWEFVMCGDPAWDLGSALHEYLELWTSSMPLDPERSVESMIAEAHYPLSALRPAIAALWDGYRDAAGLDPPPQNLEAGALLRRAVAFSAVRLLLSSHELALEQEQLPTQAVLLLQLGVNLLADPEAGQFQLYGLPGESLW